MAAITGGDQAVQVAGYASDAAAYAPEYPLATALIAARTAGAALHPARAVAGYRSERDWQARWLAERLHLNASERP